MSDKHTDWFNKWLDRASEWVNFNLSDAWFQIIPNGFEWLRMVCVRVSIWPAGQSVSQSVGRSVYTTHTFTNTNTNTHLHTYTQVNGLELGEFRFITQKHRGTSWVVACLFVFGISGLGWLEGAWAESSSWFARRAHLNAATAITIRHPTLNIRHWTLDIERRASSVECRASSVERRALKPWLEPANRKRGLAGRHSNISSAPTGDKWQSRVGVS